MTVENLSRARRRLEPDFIIAGAPKCGTTSLHFILDQHPDIGLPQDEVNYFDADDPLRWPPFFRVRNGSMDWLDTAPTNQDTSNWYNSLFAPLSHNRLLGEDSTQYLFSPMAAHRIRDRLPDARIIFMLRDPAKRAYSQYWHEMKMMRATASFESTLTSMPSIVAGSTYAPHLRHWFDTLGRDRILVLLLEDFQKDRQAALDRVADHIGVDRFDISGYELWFNRTQYPSSVRGQLLLNQIGSRVARLRYRTHMKQRWGRREHWENKIYQNWFHRVNPLLLRSDTCPSMKPETWDFLSRHLTARNDGLDTLLGRDLSQVWPSWTGAAAPPERQASAL